MSTSSIQEALTTVDALGFTCIAEENLDAAFADAGKGNVLRTCATMATEYSRDALAALLGHVPSAAEWRAFAWRWLDAHGGREWSPATVLPTQPLPAVPLPDTLGMIIGAVSVLCIIALIKHSDALSNGNIGN